MQGEGVAGVRRGSTDVMGDVGVYERRVQLRCVKDEPDPSCGRTRFLRRDGRERRVWMGGGM